MVGTLWGLLVPSMLVYKIWWPNRDKQLWEGWGDPKVSQPFWLRLWFRLLIANLALHFLWKEHFRVTHVTCGYLCDLVRADLQTQKTQMRAPISVEERVGLALWRRATGNSYRSCGLQFGYGKSTAKYICSEFEQALLRMKDQFV